MTPNIVATEASGYVGLMHTAPRRLGRRMAQGAQQGSGAKAGDGPGQRTRKRERVGAPPIAEASAQRLPPARRLWRRVRVIRRGVSILAWTCVAGAIQSAMLVAPGRGKARFARFYWHMICLLLGMRVRVVGEPAKRTNRPVVYASNHSSWLDVPVLGGNLQACFVSKEDVGHWPLVGQVARLGRTIFVSRQRGTTGRERDDMRLRLAAGDDLILFPEGTSSDGTRVLPFHSAFFAAAKPSNGHGGGNGAAAAAVECRPLVQPVSVVYDRLAGLPVGNARRAVFAWYGDMDLASHFWELAQWRRMRASIILHPPLDPADFPTRKALAQAAWISVANGAAALRQNRPFCVPQCPAPVLAQPDLAPAQSSLDKHGRSFA